MKTILIALSSFLLLVFSPVQAAEHIAWFKLQQDGFTLEYEKNEADIARQILPEIVKRFKINQLVDHHREMAIMKSKRAEVLAFIASELGMEKPGAQMSSIYDKFSLVVLSFTKALNNAREFRVWNRERLKSVLRSGEIIPGFRYIEKTDDIFFDIRSTDPLVPPFTGPLPLVLKKTDRDQMTQARDQLESYEMVVKNLQGAGVLCHEVAEAGMMADIGMVSAFRRWLCEGAANHIAVKTLEKFLGKKSAREFALTFDAKQYEDKKKHIDLVGWRAIEWDKITPPWTDDESVQAYYCHSVAAFENMVVNAKKNASPELFQLLAASKDKSDSDIYKALKTVTGKDIRKTLEAGYPPVKNPFRGFAVQVIEVLPMTRKSGGLWKVQEKSNIIPFSKDRLRGFRLFLSYSTLGQPVELKVEFTGSGMRVPDIFTHRIIKDKDTLALDRTFGEGDLKPGPALLKLFINGSLLQEKHLHLKADGQ